MKKYIDNTIKVVQVRGTSLTQESIDTLRKHAEFVDTDKDLSEFLVTVGVLHDLASETAEDSELTNLYIEVSDAEATYVHIMFI